MSHLTHVLFDVGGVLGTNGWDHHARTRAAEHFGLDPEFDARHRYVVGEWECGRMTLETYLDRVVFDRPRDFSRQEFRSFMLEQSRPHEETITLARAAHAAGRTTMATVNNESAELNAHRIRHFGLRGVFAAFLSSCWLGLRKPDPRLYERALALLQAAPAGVLFIDDREANLGPARALGMRVHHHTTAAALATALRAHHVL